MRGYVSSSEKGQLCVLNRNTEVAVAISRVSYIKETFQDRETRGLKHSSISKQDLAMAIAYFLTQMISLKVEGNKYVNTCCISVTALGSLLIFVTLTKTSPI